MPNTPKRPFHTAADADIKRGEVSDVYFARTVQILKYRGDRKRVKAEVYLKSLPEDWQWGILAGIEEVAALLEGQPVDVWAMDEGTIFEPYQPILRIEGTYVEWAQYETALRAFDTIIDPKVRRVALIDTLQDEKFEAIRVAEALGKDLYAVRLDTPSSRRGDFYRILEEVRWELQLRGFGHVKLLASGGVDEYEILSLNPVADGYGVGTSIANAPVLNFALDIMEIEGQPMAKRGKWSGAKDVYLRRGTRETVVLPAGRRPPGDGPWEPLLKPLVSAGRIVRDLPPPRTIRDFVLDQLAPMPLETLRRQGLRRDF